MKYPSIKLLFLFGLMSDCFPALTQLDTPVNNQLNQKLNIQLNVSNAVERPSQCIRSPTVS